MAFLPKKGINMMVKKLVFCFLGLILICCCVVSVKSFNNATNTKVTLIKREEVLINTDNGIIYGVHNIPQNSKREMPIVILAHGHNATHENNKYYEYLLNKNNLATLSIDFRGASSRSKSEGSTVDMTIFTEVEDLVNVIEEVKTWKSVDNKKIFLLGSSQGGLVSAITAVEKENDLAGLILLAPGFDLKEKISSIYETDFENLSEPIELGGLKFGKNFFSTIYNYDVYSNISKYKKDVLIIHGDNDKVAPVENSIKASKCYDSSTLMIIKDANHFFNNVDTKKMNKAIVEFIQNRI